MTDAEQNFLDRAVSEATARRDSPENREITRLRERIAELEHKIEVTIGTGGITVTGNLIDGSGIEGDRSESVGELHEFDGCLNGAPAIGAYYGRAMALE